MSQFILSCLICLNDVSDPVILRLNCDCQNIICYSCAQRSACGTKYRCLCGHTTTWQYPGSACHSISGPLRQLWRNYDGPKTCDRVLIKSSCRGELDDYGTLNVSYTGGRCMAKLNSDEEAHKHRTTCNNAYRTCRACRWIGVGVHPCRNCKECSCSCVIYYEGGQSIALSRNHVITFINWVQGEYHPELVAWLKGALSGFSVSFDAQLIQVVKTFKIWYGDRHGLPCWTLSTITPLWKTFSPSRLEVLAKPLGGTHFTDYVERLKKAPPDSFLGATDWTDFLFRATPIEVDAAIPDSAVAGRLRNLLRARAKKKPGDPKIEELTSRIEALRLRRAAGSSPLLTPRAASVCDDEASAAASSDAAAECD